MLQVINIRNVSAPKANQTAKDSPRLLQIDLTDGQSLCSGLEMEVLSAFSINIAPGTKVLLKNSVKVIQGIFALTPQNISILGGQVIALFEKWDINRTLAQYAHGARRPGADANGVTPPPWIPFGQKIAQTSFNDKSFKSLGAGIGEKAKEISKEDSEFLATRNEAIAAAVKIGTKKVFGGGNRQLVDHNVKKILEKGYTEEQAKTALKLARNNLERAMSNLKRRNVNDIENKPGETMRQPNNRGLNYRGGDERNERGGTKRGGRGDAAAEADVAKPSGKVSLFDFLEDKIKIPESVQIVQSHQSSKPTSSNKHLSNSCSESNSMSSRYHSRSDNQSSSNVSESNRSKFENNISSSFATRNKKDSDPRYMKKNTIANNRSKWNENSNAVTSTNFGKNSTKSSAVGQQQGQQNERSQNNNHYTQSRPNNNSGIYGNTKYSTNPKFNNNNTTSNFSDTTNRYSSTKNGISDKDNQPYSSVSISLSLQ